MNKYRILIVDDHPIVRHGMKVLIDQEPDFTTCGEAGTADAALAAVESLPPDIVIVDISLSGTDGLELIKKLRAAHPGLPVLAVSMHDENFYAERVLRAGGRGYLMKQEATDKIIQAIHRVLQGEIYLSERMASRMIGQFVKGRGEEAKSPVDRLTDRELEVFRMIGQGRSTRQIAEDLHISIKTVEAYRAHIKEKLSLKTAHQLVQHAIEWVHHEV
ncbi:MAG TPA: response regulator transcription factor [Acidobacteriota bacterium]|nr:response regulator transcription factor [Acidobacteriota bacterium]